MDAVKHRESPFKGPIPYSEGDADFFFGREKDTRLIIANLFSAPLTLLYGVSGVGKSSVLRAGVAHHISQRDDIVAVTFTDWEKTPLEGLKAAVARELSPRLPAAAAAEPDGEPPGLDEPLSDFLKKWASLVGCRVAILLDQFEDYFPYHPKNSHFALEFASAVMQSEAPVSFLISIREDTYASLDRFEGILPVIFDNYLRLDPLGRQAAQVAIEKPVERYNELYVTDGKPYSVEPGLVTAVLEQVKVGALGLGPARGSQKKGESRGYQLDTVYLQLVMTRLWAEEVKGHSRTLRNSTLDRLGGAKKIVRMHLEGVMDELTPKEKRVAAMVFRYLVTPTGTKVAYPVDELAKYEKDVRAADLSVVLKKLAEGENRILRQVPPVPGLWPEPRYEIFHDALGDAILDWGMRYIRDREQEEVTREIESRREQALKELQQKRRQVRWLLAILVLFITFILLVVAVRYAIKNREAAETARAEAERQRTETERQKAQLEKALELVSQQDLAVKYTKKVLRGHGGPVTSVAFSRDNRWVVTGSKDGTAMLWDANTGTAVVGKLQGHTGAVNAVAVSENGGLVATASDDHTACLWDSGSGRRLSTMGGHTAPVLSVGFSSDGNYVLTASADGTARVWKTGEANSRHVLRGHDGAVLKAEFSPDGKLILTASEDQTARIWDADSGEEKFVLGGHAGFVNSARFSPDGKTVVTASQDSTARTWDADSGAIRTVLVGHAGSVNYAEFSPDGEHIVTASSDKTARIWQASTGKSYAILAGHGGKVNVARFSPDGTRIVTASDDKTARTWNAQSSSKNSLVELSGHTGEVNTAIFSSDNTSLLTASNDGTARIWDIGEFGGFKVSEASIEPVDYRGPCPAVLRVDAKIVVEEGSGLIRYRIVRSDRAATQTFDRMVDSTGPTFVTYLIGVPKDSAPINGKISIEVVDPTPVTSSKVPLRIRCPPSAEATPTPAPTPTPSASNHPASISSPHPPQRRVRAAASLRRRAQRARTPARA